MKIDLDHEPGELRAKLPDLVAELVEMALGDDPMLRKAQRHRGAPHREHADDFRFAATRTAYDRAIARAEACRGRINAQIQAL